MPRSTARDPNAIKSFGLYRVTCVSSSGETRWADEAINALYDEGEFAILDIALRNGTAPSAWYLGLMKNSLAGAPAESSTLASLAAAGPYELNNTSDPGYSSRLVIARDATSAGWPTLVLDSGDYMATSLTVQWTATANWADTVRWLFLTTVGTPGDVTGKLISFAQLPFDRIVYANDTLKISYSLKLQ